MKLCFSESEGVKHFKIRDSQKEKIFLSTIQQFFEVKLSIPVLAEKWSENRVMRQRDLLSHIYLGPEFNNRAVIETFNYKFKLSTK